MQASSPTWFLAQFKPNCAQIAKQNLTRQGIPTFLPLEAETRRQNGKFITKLQPLFPGYLFVSLDIAQGLWRKVNSTYGVSKLVSFSQLPAPVPSDLVAQLMASCDHEGALQSAGEIRSGEQVALIKGPFADAIAEIEHVTPDRRVWVLMDIMGRRTRIAVGDDQIKTI